MSWDHRWLSLAAHYATWSKDRSRKVGAVIVGARQVQLSQGWNGFPRGVNDEAPERHDRPAKYSWTEHAERNAIFNAAAEGIRLRGSTLYLAGDVAFPCADCARAIVQAGIEELVCGVPLPADEHFAHDVAASILSEGCVHVRRPIPAIMEAA